MEVGKDLKKKKKNPTITLYIYYIKKDVLLIFQELIQVVEK